MITYAEAATNYVEAVAVVKAYELELIKARAAWAADEKRWAGYQAAMDQWQAAKRREHEAQQILNHLNSAARLAQGWERLRAVPVLDLHECPGPLPCIEVNGVPVQTNPQGCPVVVSGRWVVA
ncbi:hypothetical protein SEA_SERIALPHILLER_22 [Arthrobacter phage SerialPhiller]|nr:hypothetical protein SEA_ARIELAGOS_22 [Arthrobacter phage Arielagos]WNT45254.1 hypothetical protein SEA_SERIALPHILLER_22 [Arthrobacter phage SerialPhiller]